METEEKGTLDTSPAVDITRGGVVVQQIMQHQITSTSSSWTTIAERAVEVCIQHIRTRTKQIAVALVA